MEAFIFPNVHVQNLGTQNILLRKCKGSFDTGIAKNLSKFRTGLKDNFVIK